MREEERKLLAEMIGTFALVFIGAGAVSANSFLPNSVGLIGIALAHGLVLMSMIYATSHISGTHINPAVTIGMIATKKINVTLGIFYIIAQLIGASVAGFLLSMIFPNQINTVFLGTPDLALGVGFLRGTIVEAVLTFFLVLTIFGIAIDQRSPKSPVGLAVGLVLTFDILMGGPLTGGAMNPARAFGPAIASNHWSNHLVYWIGPIIGSLVAAFIYDKIFLKK